MRLQSVERILFVPLSSSVLFEVIWTAYLFEIVTKLFRLTVGRSFALQTLQYR